MLTQDDEGETTLTDFPVTSNVIPIVELDPILVTDITLDQGAGTATITLSGTVRDAIADNAPAGPVSTGQADIETVQVLVNGQPTGVLANVVSNIDPDDPNPLWRQHPYVGTFSGLTVQVPIDDAQTIRIETSVNAVGNKGFDEVWI